MPNNPSFQQSWENGNGNGNSSNSKPTFGEKLGLLATTLTAIGDVLAVIAANILIQEGIADAEQQDKEKKDQEQKLTNMQKQIENLQKELNSLKKQTK